MSVYYNENDPFAAKWLRELVSAGVIPGGFVDSRSILEVCPDELEKYNQCHFFAGIGGWAHALQLAKWPTNRTVWTGSCPCQPFSSAGKSTGKNDDRHLWPIMFQLIQAAKPPVFFGEQVAGKNGFAWIDDVSADLEGAGYDFGAADLCAAGVGAPHLRQRLYFVGSLADPNGRPSGRNARAADRAEKEECSQGTEHGHLGHEPIATGAVIPDRRDHVRQLGDSNDSGLQGHAGDGASRTGRQEQDRPAAEAGGPVNGFWHNAEWIPCNDPKGERWRPVEPGTFPMAHGIPGRVGTLRGYGNAIVAPLAAEFIGAYLDTQDQP